MPTDGQFFNYWNSYLCQYVDKCPATPGEVTEETVGGYSFISIQVIHSSDILIANGCRCSRRDERSQIFLFIYSFFSPDYLSLV